MNQEQIEARQRVLEEQFNVVKQEVNTKREEILSKEVELEQLRGRYSELDELKQSLEPEIPGGTPAANVLEVEPASNELLMSPEDKEQTNAKRKG